MAGIHAERPNPASSNLSSNKVVYCDRSGIADEDENGEKRALRGTLPLQSYCGQFARFTRLETMMLPIPMSVNETLDRLVSLENTDVCVMGILHFDFEHTAIEHHSKAERRSGYNSSIWLDVGCGSLGFDPAVCRRLNGKRVVVQGTLFGPDPAFGGCGHMSLWPAAVRARTLESAGGQREETTDLVDHLVPKPSQLVVISDGVYEGDVVEGVRYPSPEHMSGWWLTTDRYNGDIQSLKTVHFHHIAEFRPDLCRYLGLPFGSRFFSGDGHTWFDQAVADSEP